MLTAPIFFTVILSAFRLSENVFGHKFVTRDRLVVAIGIATKVTNRRLWTFAAAVDGGHSVFTHL